MRRFAILLCVVLLGVSLFATAALAQSSDTTLPTVITFTADLPGITLADAEAGTTPVTLTWTAVNTQAGQTLTLDAYILQHWVSLLPTGETLEASGQRTLMVEHPLNFGTPTYRLSILGTDGSVIDQRILSLPYLDSTGTTPTMSAFTSSASEVAPGENGVAIVPVAWQVTNRIASSYLTFEQVLPTGQIVSIDLPRTTLWVASQGEGAVAPTIPAGAATVTLLMRVVDAASGQTYDTAELTLPVAGMAAPAPVVTPDVTPTDPGTPVDPVAVNIFYFQPTLVGTALEGQFALVWDVSGVPSVQVAYTDAAGNPVVRSGLKPTGNLMVPLAEVGFAPEAGRYQFTLTATDSNGVALTDSSGVPISRQVEMVAESPIVINSFASDSTIINPDQPVGLSWDVSGASSITLTRLSVQNGTELFSQVLGEALPVAGSQQFTMPAIAETGFFGENVTFLLVADDDSGLSRVAYVRLPLAGASGTEAGDEETTQFDPPLSTEDLAIDLFQVEPTNVTPGSAVSIAWETTGAARVWLAQSSPDTGMMATIADNLPVAGSLQIAVPAEISTEDLPLATGFVLNAENAAGETTRQDVLVNIIAP